MANLMLPSWMPWLNLNALLMMILRVLSPGLVGVGETADRGRRVSKRRAWVPGPDTLVGKHHNQALIALARRRCDTLYATLRDGTPSTKLKHQQQLDEQHRDTLIRERQREGIVLASSARKNPA